MAMNEIDLDGGRRNICRDCVDKIQVRGKSETLKKVVNSTVYGTDKSDEDDKKLEWTVVGGGGDEVSVMPVVYPHGKVSVSSLVFFPSVG